jgi:hypothetical protein
VDFPLQFPRHYLNKGTYGDIRGLEHSLWHGLVTFCILAFFTSLILSGIIAVLEVIAHYHIDWAKMNINRYYNLAPNTSEQFWWLLGLDQWFHYMTYVLIIMAVL